MSKQDSTAEGRPSGIQVIARAAAIMRVLGNHPQGLSLGAIAHEVGLPRSTVQRIIHALEMEDLAESIGAGGGFRLGAALGQLMYQTHTDILSRLRPLLVALSSQLQESVCVCALKHDEVIVIDHIVAERELRVVFPVGTLHAPVYASAPGKAMLATLTDAEVEALLPDPLPKITRHTRDRSTLLQELAETRETRLATDHGEHLEGVSAFAVWVDTYLGLFAIAVVLPSSRAAESSDMAKQVLLEYKQDIEEKIGRKARTLEIRSPNGEKKAR